MNKEVRRPVPQLGVPPGRGGAGRAQAGPGLPAAARHAEQLSQPAGQAESTCEVRPTDRWAAKCGAIQGGTARPDHHVQSEPLQASQGPQPTEQKLVGG